MSDTITHNVVVPVVSKDTKLTAVVRYRKTEKKQCPVVTEVTILAKDLVVAFGTIGGRFSQIDAMKEFKRLPGRFKKGDYYGLAIALGLK